MCSTLIRINPTNARVNRSLKHLHPVSGRHPDLLLHLRGPHLHPNRIVRLVILATRVEVTTYARPAAFDKPYATSARGLDTSHVSVAHNNPRDCRNPLLSTFFRTTLLRTTWCSHSRSAVAITSTTRSRSTRGGRRSSWSTREVPLPSWRRRISWK